MKPPLSGLRLQAIEIDRLNERIAALTAEVERLQALIAFMDSRMPLADETCDEPGIRYSEACRREMRDLGL